MQPWHFRALGVRRLAGVLAIAAAGCPATASLAAADCPGSYGDVNGDQTADVLDAQCLAAAALAALAGQSHECVQPGAEPDLDGDGYQTVLDVVIGLTLALGGGLPAEIDSNENGCHDASESSCGDGVCWAAGAEACFSCALDCGACDEPCCAAHPGADCAQPGVAACVCEISPFCCEVVWDESCAQVAVEFCAAKCGGPTCVVTGTLACGQTVEGNTAGGSTVLGDYAALSDGACNAAGDGPERVFKLSPPADVPAELFLDLPDGATAYRLDGACEAASCSSALGAKSPLQLAAGESAYVVIEGPSGATAPFALALLCPSDCNQTYACGASVCGTGVCAGQEFVCGVCDFGFECSEGGCQLIQTQCGNDVCEPGETISNCIIDCAQTADCGNGLCDPFETITCPLDCGGNDACPGPGSCTQAQSTPGCADEICCNAVCGLVPQCCNAAWDAGCAAFAANSCQ